MLTNLKPLIRLSKGLAHSLLSVRFVTITIKRTAQACGVTRSEPTEPQPSTSEPACLPWVPREGGPVRVRGSGVVPDSAKQRLEQFEREVLEQRVRKLGQGQNIPGIVIK